MACLALLWTGPARADDRLRLTSSMVDAAASRRLGEVKSCYRAAVGRDPHAFGVLAIGMRVDAQGNTGERWIAMSTLSDPALEECALKAFEQLKFPPPGATGAVVQFGMLLTVDDKKKTDLNTANPDRAKLEEDAWHKAVTGSTGPAGSSTPPPESGRKKQPDLPGFP